MSAKIELEARAVRELARKADAIVARHGSTAKAEIETGIPPTTLNKLRRLNRTHVNQTFTSDLVARIERAYVGT